MVTTDEANAMLPHSLALAGQIGSASINAGASMRNNASEDKLKRFLQGGELENNRLIAQMKLSEDSRHNREMEGTNKLNAQTTEGYRQDQAQKMREDATINKLKALLTGSGGSGGMTGEMQKTSNLADTARDSLNNTEALAKEHPIAAASQTALQAIPLVGDALSNSIAGLAGGPFKAVRDSRAGTKEAMQNLYTGAAASGEQVPAFQGFAGPGALDILQGKVDTSGSTRDAINTFQQRQQQAAPRLTPEMMKAAGLSNDPIAQQALQAQEQQRQAALQQKLSKMAPQDRQLYEEIHANPQHPNAAKAARDLKRRYGAF